MSANKFAKFYFTDYGNSDAETFPILVKTSEKHIRILLRKYIDSFNAVIEDNPDFHEMLLKYGEFETTFLFLREDNDKTLINLMVNGQKIRHAYKEILRIRADLTRLLKDFLIEDFMSVIG